MRFLVDAGLSPIVVTQLRSAGHDCAYVPDLFPPRTSDAAIAAFAQSTRECIVTRDFGFADVREYVPHDYLGIIVLTVPPGGGSRYIGELVQELLARLPDLEPLRGKLLIVERGRIRVRE